MIKTRGVPSRLYDCGDGVSVGNSVVCDLSGSHFDRVVHCYKPSNLNPTETCQCLLDPGMNCNGIKVNWGEVEEVETMSPTVLDVAAYAAVPGSLLVHCTAGHCRSPHLAIVAKVVRGVPIDKALSDITRAVYNGCGLAPAWQWQTLTSIYRWDDNR